MTGISRAGLGLAAAVGLVLLAQAATAGTTAATRVETLVRSCAEAGAGLGLAANGTACIACPAGATLTGGICMIPEQTEKTGLVASKKNLFKGCGPGRVGFVNSCYSCPADYAPTTDLDHVNLVELPKLIKANDVCVRRIAAQPVRPSAWVSLKTTCPQGAWTQPGRRECYACPSGSLPTPDGLGDPQGPLACLTVDPPSVGDLSARVLEALSFQQNHQKSQNRFVARLQIIGEIKSDARRGDMMKETLRDELGDPDSDVRSVILLRGGELGVVGGQRVAMGYAMSKFSPALLERLIQVEAARRKAHPKSYPGVDAAFYQDARFQPGGTPPEFLCRKIAVYGGSAGVKFDAASFWTLQGFTGEVDGLAGRGTGVRFKDARVPDGLSYGFAWLAAGDGRLFTIGPPWKGPFDAKAFSGGAIGGLSGFGMEIYDQGPADCEALDWTGPA